VFLASCAGAMGDYYASSSDARTTHSGQYGGWLTKQKGDGAKAKWFSSSTKRFFTIDYDSQIFFYSHSEDRKNNSQPTRFRDIICAELLCGDGRRSSFGFRVGTYEREYELITTTHADATKWVEGLNAARDIANGKKPSGPQGSMSSASTTVDGGSESGGSTPPLAQYGGGFGPNQHGPSGGYHQQQFLAQSQDPQHQLAHQYYQQQQHGNTAGYQQAAAQPPQAWGRQSSQPTAAWGHQGSTQKAALPPAWQPQPEAARHDPYEQHLASPEPQSVFAERSQHAALAIPALPQDAFAALDALEELAGPATVQYCSLEQIQKDARKERIREAQRAATGAKRQPKSDESPSVVMQPPVPAQAPAAAPSQALAEVAPPPQQLLIAQLLPPALPAQSPAPQVTEPVVSDRMEVAPFDEPELSPLPAVNQARTRAQAQHLPPPPAPANAGAASRRVDADSWDSDDEPSRRQPHSAVIQPAPVVDMSADDDWDSDDGAGAAVPQKSIARPLPTGNAHPVAQAPAFAPPVQESGWDDSDEEDARRPRGVRADACGAPQRDACGAPARAGDAFVAARPSQAAAPAAPPPRAGNDLDDLMGELDMATAEPVNLDGMVPNFQCTQCDHQVMRVSNFIWNDAVDYMFCRNFYPDTKKLRHNLVPRKGCSAFCCQCSWKSADSAAALTDVAEGLRWKVLA